MLCTAVGLLLTPLAGLVVAQAKDPPVKSKPLPLNPLDKPKAATSCSGDYGTSILFEETPKEAAARAKKEEKLVFVLHVSGHFEDPKLT
jgi:hypothetical protein